jgi:pimeloyl-ACP methyl ester carboxylesterase
MEHTQKPILIFVPGGWHTPSTFEPTTSLLSEAGYHCISISLPTIGSELRNEPAPQNWNLDVAAIRNTLLEHIDQGRDVVLIVHSYGGTVGSEACNNLGKTHRESQGLRGGVIKLVYLTAVVMDIGHYIWEATGGKPFDAQRTVMDGDLCYARDTVPWFYNECTVEQQEALPNKLQSHAWKAFLSPVTYTAWRDIPGIYLMAEKDQALPFEFQKAMLDAATGHRFEIAMCDADHSSFVSRPEVVVRVIRRAAGEEV